MGCCCPRTTASCCCEGVVGCCRANASGETGVAVVVVVARWNGTGGVGDCFEGPRLQLPPDQPIGTLGGVAVADVGVVDVDVGCCCRGNNRSCCLACQEKLLRKGCT